MCVCAFLWLEYFAPKIKCYKNSSGHVRQTLLYTVQHTWDSHSSFFSLIVPFLMNVGDKYQILLIIFFVGPTKAQSWCRRHHHHQHQLQHQQQQQNEQIVNIVDFLSWCVCVVMNKFTFQQNQCAPWQSSGQRGNQFTRPVLLMFPFSLYAVIIYGNLCLAAKHRPLIPLGKSKRKK